MQCPKCQYVRTAHETCPNYECPKCGIVYAKFDPNYVRPVTRSEIIRKEEDAKAAAKRAADEAQWQRDEAERVRERQIANLCLTTTHTVPGHEITAIVDVISAECVMGVNIIKDNIAAVSDIFGGRSGTLQDSLRAARREAMRELRRDAYSAGADAVVGIGFAYSEISGIGKSMLFVVVTGTAVKLKPT